MAHSATNVSEIGHAVRQIRAAISRIPDRQRARLLRQCEIVERYDAFGETRES